MAKLHNTSVTGDINASGRIFANGKAVAPLEHTHALDQITGLNDAIDTKLRNATVATAENSNKLNGKPADQYALKTDLTALGEQLNQIQYSITKVFKCPNYVSSSYDNNYVKITLSDRLANSTNKALIIEDNTKKFIINQFGIPNFYSNKIILKDKIDITQYTSYSHAIPTIYRVSDTTFIVGGICTSTANELASITLQSSEPITADDFTISARDQAYNLNTASIKKTLSIKELIPYFAEKYIDTSNFGYLYSIKKPNISYDRRLDIRLESTSSTVYIYDLSSINKIVLGVNGNGVTLYYNETYNRTPVVATSGLYVYIDLSTISNDFVILGNCIASYSTSNMPSFATQRALPEQVQFIDERTALTYHQVLDLLNRSVIINNTVYDTKYNIDTNSTQSFPTTTVNGQALTIGSSNTITARANGGNADTVGGLSPNSFITTDNLAYRYFSKVAVYNNDNHLIHPDGTEEWIEYQRPEPDDGFDHL